MSDMTKTPETDANSFLVNNLMASECVLSEVSRKIEIDRDYWKTKVIGWMDLTPERDRAVFELKLLRKICAGIAKHNGMAIYSVEGQKALLDYEEYKTKYILDEYEIPKT